jgi:hypothetical protein
MGIIIWLLKYPLIKIQEINENLRYSPSTIVEKFRKQGAKIGKTALFKSAN